MQPIPPLLFFSSCRTPLIRYTFITKHCKITLLWDKECSFIIDKCKNINEKFVWFNKLYRISIYPLNIRKIFCVSWIQYLFVIWYKNSEFELLFYFLDMIACVFLWLASTEKHLMCQSYRKIPLICHSITNTLYNFIFEKKLKYLKKHSFLSLNIAEKTQMTAKDS